MRITTCPASATGSATSSILSPARGAKALQTTAFIPARPSTRHAHDWRLEIPSRNAPAVRPEHRLMGLWQRDFAPVSRAVGNRGTFTPDRSDRYGQPAESEWLMPAGWIWNAARLTATTAAPRAWHGVDPDRRHAGNWAPTACALRSCAAESCQQPKASCWPHSNLGSWTGCLPAR